MHPSFGMKTIQDIRDLFAQHHPESPRKVGKTQSSSAWYLGMPSINFLTAVSEDIFEYSHNL